MVNLFSYTSLLVCFKNCHIFQRTPNQTSNGSMVFLAHNMTMQKYPYIISTGSISTARANRADNVGQQELTCT